MKTYAFLWIMTASLVAGSHSLLAQNKSHAEKLPWVRGEFPKQKGNFEYMIGRGEGRSLTEARDNAMNDVLVEVGNQKGVNVSGSTLQEIKSQMNFNDNKSDYSESNATVSTFKIDRQTFTLSMLKVDEYYEYNGAYQVWQLYEVNLKGDPFKPVTIETTDRYGMSAGWRSALLPGWGQFHKGKVGKGVFFLATEVAAISGLVYCEMKRSDNIRLSQETTNLTIVKEYRDRADTWSLRRNICVGAAAGIYVWNVLDAALSKGKIRYAWIPDNLHLTGAQEFGNYYAGVSIHF
ncbi:MAG: hypothetical protein LBS25_01490 [Candidatus Symbiothrix sp.]|jgi:hypothetical protein|nr:hypothetical protein [Candidatus Symbiothrix sp.]